MVWNLPECHPELRQLALLGDALSRWRPVLVSGFLRIGQQAAGGPQWSESCRPTLVLSVSSHTLKLVCLSPAPTSGRACFKGAWGMNNVKHNWRGCHDGAQPINNVVMVSGEQRKDSAIHTHVSILPQTPLPSRLPHNVEQSSLCCTAGPCWLSILNTALC